MNTVSATIASALIGGTISAATGGKFANGAVTGAMQMAMGRAAADDLMTGSRQDGLVGESESFDLALSASYPTADSAAVAFGKNWGPVGIADRIEYNTAIVEHWGPGGFGPPAYAYTTPLAGQVGATTVPLSRYIRAVGAAYGRSSIVAIAHNHWDGNLKFSGLGLDTSIARVMPLYLYNRAGQTRVLNADLIRRELQSSSTRGASALQHYINTNGGMNGRCIHGCN